MKWVNASISSALPAMSNTLLSLIYFLLIILNTSLSSSLTLLEEKKQESRASENNGGSQSPAPQASADCNTLVNGSYCLNPDTLNQIQQKCPYASATVLKNYMPRGMTSAGVYTELQNVTKPEQCAESCCLDPNCNYGFIINATCFLLSCTNGSFLCTPTSSYDSSGATDFSMILVRKPLNSKYGMSCEVGVEMQCGANLFCLSTNNTRSRNGICSCESGFVMRGDKCVDKGTPPAESVELSSTQSPPAVALTVSVTSKNVTLPINEVSLFAYTVPQASPGHPYSYKWTLISNPTDDTATVEGQTTETLRLTGLKTGVYIYQITVTSLESNGSANASITVLPEKKPNLAPIAVISPQEQTIQLPTSSAVLDASLSTDDDKIISYKWELQKGPILYGLSPSKVLNSSTLQVENLIPGNYTFKLTVEDSEHITNSTTANVTVIKQPDYPPTANPGKDIVVYLPQTEVTLNGNASSDDKKIVDFEWKATGEPIKAIDMQDTHTPYLKLSHLQVGLYQFELKVTDEAGQSHSATVHVIVKEPSGNPPKADAGVDQTTVLDKQNWMILDSSKSKSDSNKIIHYTWTQLKGPNNASILPIDNGIKANVSGLTKGEYEFILVVEDDSQLKSNDSVKITVIQRVNEAPHASAGGNIKIKLPLTVVQLNGSRSTDDVKIVNWRWERQPESLAAGIILLSSDNSSILQLANLVPGKYIFKLTVKDEQGLTDSDIATVTVEGEVHSRDMIEIILGVQLTQFTESDKNKVIQQLVLLLHDTKLVLTHVESQLHSGNAVLQLYGLDKAEEIINGSSLAADLRKKLYQDAGLLKFPIYSIDTVLCLDDCSGHGVCQDTLDGRECACSAFWMENILKKRFGNRERNCEWSKIYVGVVVSLLLVMLFALIWSLTFIFRRNFKALKENSNGSPVRSNGKRYHSQKKQYTLLDDEEMELRAQEDDEDAESEDSDSDILFESNKRSGKSKNGSVQLIPLTGNGTVRNGILKNSRRTKT